MPEKRDDGGRSRDQSEDGFQPESMTQARRHGPPFMASGDLLWVKMIINTSPIEETVRCGNSERTR
jgi:hypothetical protein